MVENTCMRGTMIYFNEEKHIGFIRTDDGERIQVLRSGFLPGQAPVGRCGGLPVEFSLSDEESPAAVEVSVVEDAVVKRARRRSRR
jgi:cold shock CspA family protein